MAPRSPPGSTARGRSCRSTSTRRARRCWAATNPAPRRPPSLRSAWYRLPPRAEAGPLLVVSAAGRFDAREVQVQWAGDDAEGGGQRQLRRRRIAAGVAQPAPAAVGDPGQCHPDPAHRHRRRPRPPALDRADPAADRRTCARCRKWSAPKTRCCSTGWWGWRSRASGRSATTLGVIEVPKWRILPDRFGAEANSPVMDNLGGGPLGIIELLLRATTVADLPQRRLVSRLGHAAAPHAVLPGRQTGPARSRFRNTQRTVEPGADAPLTRVRLLEAATRPASSADIGTSHTIEPRARQQR